MATNTWATRTFQRADGGETTLTIYPPVPVERDDGSEPDWSCRVTVIGLDGEDWDVNVGGVDAVQAMVCALAVARKVLYSNPTPLTFMGSEGLALGMPEPKGWNRRTHATFLRAFEQAMQAALDDRELSLEADEPT